jgi:hypothetical protein
MYIERQQIVEELRLRKLIQQAIHIVENKTTTITEKAVGDTKKAPYDNTGLNTLNSLFDNILTQLENGYKGLASEKEQRDSFSAHILVNVENALQPLMNLDDKDKALAEEIDVNIGSDTPENMKDIRLSDEEKAKEDFTIAGRDLTGRDAAYVAFVAIQTQIIDAYKTLHNTDDIKAFYDGLLMNLDAYFNKFEDEMKATVEKPEIPTGEPVSPEPDVGGDDMGDMDLEDIADM